MLFCIPILHVLHFKQLEYLLNILRLPDFWATVCKRAVCLSCPVCNVGVLWPNGWMDQDETGMQVGLGPGHTVSDGDPSIPQRDTAPQFLADIYCGQMARWIKMPLGTEVGLDPSDIVLDRGSSSPPQKGGRAPQQSAHVYCGQTAA